MTGTDPNLFFRVRLGQGEAALRILLSQKATASMVSAEKTDGKSANRRGSTNRLKGRRPEDEIIPKKKQQGGLINFWDLAQVLVDDEWTEPDFDYVPVIEWDETEENFLVESYPDSSWESMRDTFFAVPTNEWHTTFRKLSYEDAEKYGIDIVDLISENLYSAARVDSRRTYVGTAVTGTEWETGGLRISAPMAQWELNTYGTFQAFSNIADCKVTTTQDYDDTDVGPLTLAQQADVFLVPFIGFWLGETPDTDPLEVMLGRHDKLDRSFWLPRNYPISGYPLFTFDFNAAPSPADMTDILTYAKIDARLFDTTDGTELSIGSFPSGASKLQHDSVLPIDSSRMAGTLLAVVYQKGTFYYLWDSVGVATGASRVYDL